MSIRDWFVPRKPSAANDPIRDPGAVFEQLEPRLLLSSAPCLIPDVPEVAALQYHPDLTI
jgi:hypothetical protein